MRHRAVLAATLASLLLPLAAAAQTVVIVRHAEKAEDSRDPDLSAAGQARAAALADSLAGARVTAVIATPFKRTLQTAQPTAALAPGPVTPVAVDGGVAAHAERVAAEVRRAGPDATVLVVGHSNTVPAIAAALGDPAPTPLTECDYDRMTIIRVGATPPAVVHVRYGAVSASC